MHEAVKLLGQSAAWRAARARPAAVGARAGLGVRGGLAMPPEPPEAGLAAGEAALLGERLRAAEAAARAGRWDAACGLCAAVVLDHQPQLAGSARLLRRVIATLLRCRAFGQLTRLLAALQGRTIRFSADPAEGTAEPAEQVLDPGWFTGADAERLILRWADALAGPSLPVGTPAAASAGMASQLAAY
jgi:hypothetical protein